MISYEYNMTRRAISITLESDNVTWLKGRAGAEGESVSELIDQLVTSARSGKRAGPARYRHRHDRHTMIPIRSSSGPMRRCVRRSPPRSGVQVPFGTGRPRIARKHESRERVADPECAVTDTHPLLFHAAGGSRLGPRAAAFFSRCERREAILYVPAAVMWECSLLARAARVNLRRSVRGFFRRPLQQSGLSTTRTGVRTNLPCRRAALHARPV